LGDDSTDGLVGYPTTYTIWPRSNSPELPHQILWSKTWSNFFSLRGASQIPSTTSTVFPVHRRLVDPNRWTSVHSVSQRQRKHGQIDAQSIRNELWSVHPFQPSWTCLGPFRTEEFDRWLNGVNALKDFFEYTVSFSHRMICIIDSLEHLLVTSPKRSKVFQRFHFKRSCFHQLFDIYWVRVCLGEKSQTVCPVVNGSKPKVPNSW
jgi:hypothetical protein